MLTNESMEVGAVTVSADLREPGGSRLEMRSGDPGAFGFGE
jgi:hypothetical protein